MDLETVVTRYVADTTSFDEGARQVMSRLAQVGSEAEARLGAIDARFAATSAKGAAAMSSLAASTAALHVNIPAMSIDVRGVAAATEQVQRQMQSVERQASATAASVRASMSNISQAITNAQALLSDVRWGTAGLQTLKVAEMRGLLGVVGGTVSAGARRGDILASLEGALIDRLERDIESAVRTMAAGMPAAVAPAGRRFEGIAHLFLTPQGALTAAAPQLMLGAAAERAIRLPAGRDRDTTPIPMPPAPADRLTRLESFLSAPQQPALTGRAGMLALPPHVPPAIPLGMGLGPIPLGPGQAAALRMSAANLRDEIFSGVTDLMEMTGKEMREVLRSLDVYAPTSSRAETAALLREALVGRLERGMGMVPLPTVAGPASSIPLPIIDPRTEVMREGRALREEMLAGMSNVMRLTAGEMRGMLRSLDVYTATTGKAEAANLLQSELMGRAERVAGMISLPTVAGLPPAIALPLISAEAQRRHLGARIDLERLGPEARGPRMPLEPGLLDIPRVMERYKEVIEARIAQEMAILRAQAQLPIFTREGAYRAAGGRSFSTPFVGTNVMFPGAQTALPGMELPMTAEVQNAIRLQRIADDRRVLEQMSFAREAMRRAAFPGIDYGRMRMGPEFQGTTLDMARIRAGDPIPPWGYRRSQLALPPALPREGGFLYDSSTGQWVPLAGTPGDFSDRRLAVHRPFFNLPGGQFGAMMPRDMRGRPVFGPPAVFGGGGFGGGPPRDVDPFWFQGNEPPGGWRRFWGPQPDLSAAGQPWRWNWQASAVSGLIGSMGGRFAGLGGALGGGLGGPIGGAVGIGVGAGIDVVSASLSKMIDLGVRATSTLVDLGVRGAEWAVRLGAEWERMTVTFGVMTGSMETGRRVLAEIEQVALVSPYRTQELARHGEVLLGYGIRPEDVAPSLSRLGDIAAGNEDKFRRLALAFGQVLSAGRFMGQEKRQFAEAGVGIEDFAKTADMSTAEFLSAMRRGEIGADIVVATINRLTDAGGRFAGIGRMVNLSTVAGQWEEFMERLEKAAKGVAIDFFKEFNVAQRIGDFSATILSFQGDVVSAFKDFVDWGGRAAKTFEPLVIGFQALAGFGLDEFRDLFKELPSFEDIGPSIEAFAVSTTTFFMELANEAEILVLKIIALKEEMLALAKIAMMPTAIGLAGQFGVGIGDAIKMLTGGVGIDALNVLARTDSDTGRLVLEREARRGTFAEEARQRFGGVMERWRVADEWRKLSNTLPQIFGGEAAAAAMFGKKVESQPGAARQIGLYERFPATVARLAEEFERGEFGEGVRDANDALREFESRVQLVARAARTMPMMTEAERATAGALGVGITTALGGMMGPSAGGLTSGLMSVFGAGGFAITQDQQAAANRTAFEKLWGGPIKDVNKAGTAMRTFEEDMAKIERGTFAPGGGLLGDFMAAALGPPSITEDQAAILQVQAFEKLEQAIGDLEVKMAPAALMGSSEAQDIINRTMTQQTDLMERIRAALEEANEAAKRREKHIEDSAGHLKVIREEVVKKKGQVVGKPL